MMKTARLNKDTDRQNPSDGAYCHKFLSYKCSHSEPKHSSTMLTLTKRKYHLLAIYTGLFDLIWFILHQKVYYLSTFFHVSIEISQAKNFPSTQNFLWKKSKFQSTSRSPGSSWENCWLQLCSVLHFLTPALLKPVCSCTLRYFISTDFLFGSFGKLSEGNGYNKWRDNEVQAILSVR